MAVTTVIILNENRQVIEFKTIDPVNASDYGLTETEIDDYNRNLPIINLVADDFSNRYSSGEVLTQEEAIDAYRQTATNAGLSEKVQNVVSQIVTHSFQTLDQDSRTLIDGRFE